MKTRITLVIVVLVIVALVIVIPQAYAASTIRYKLFFLNSIDDECTSRNYDAMTFYNQATKKYLSLYSVKYQESEPECITSNTDSSYLADITSSHDLIIMMTDIVASQSHLLDDSHAWGYYTYTGGTHVIVSNSRSLFTKSDSSAWTLTHELSHFILRIQNQPESVWINWVHNIQNQVSKCKSETSWDYYYGSIKNCPTSLYKTISMGSKKVPVMQLYQASNSKSGSSSSSYSYDTRTILSLNKIPSYAEVGQKITFSGSLKTYEGLAVQGATIYVKDEDAGSGDETLAYATTDSKGKFSVSWYAKDTDFWDSTIEIYAVFEGNSQVQKSKTPIYRMSVIE